MLLVQRPTYAVPDLHLPGNVQLLLACRFKLRPQILSQGPWGASDNVRLEADRQAYCVPRLGTAHSDLSVSVNARVKCQWSKDTMLRQNVASPKLDEARTSPTPSTPLAKFHPLTREMNLFCSVLVGTSPTFQPRIPSPLRSTFYSLFKALFKSPCSDKHPSHFSPVTPPGQRPLALLWTPNSER